MSCKLRRAAAHANDETPAVAYCVDCCIVNAMCFECFIWHLGRWHGITNEIIAAVALQRQLHEARR
jgi:hypothetical protein